MTEQRARWGLSGVVSGLLLLHSRGISHSCEYSFDPKACGDPKNNRGFPFGPPVDTQEHCNAFIYSYPKRSDTAVTCF